MAKEEKKEEKAKKVEKKVTKKQPITTKHKYSLNELSDIFGVSITTMRSMYQIRGLDLEEKLTFEEASEKFNK